MSRSLRRARCWNPSSRTITSGWNADSRKRAPRTLSSSTTTTQPGNFPRDLGRFVAGAVGVRQDLHAVGDGDGPRRGAAVAPRKDRRTGAGVEDRADDVLDQGGLAGPPGRDVPDRNHGRTDGADGEQSPVITKIPCGDDRPIHPGERYQELPERVQHGSSRQREDRFGDTFRRARDSRAGRG